MRWVTVSAQLAASILSVSLAARQASAPADLSAIVERLGARVEQYYTRARTIVCVETVRLQPLRSDLAPDGFGRRLVYELRVGWDPAADGDAPREASVLRQILTIDGRPPRPKDDPGCMDPKPVSAEPLAFLLPARRSEYVFSYAGTGRTDGHPAELALLMGVICAVLAICFAVFLTASRISRLLGVTGNVVLSRLLGVILAALAVQYVLDGVRAAFAT